MEILRAGIFHTPQNPFHFPDSLIAYPDGGLLTDQGKILACGDFTTLRAASPDTPVRDLRGGFLLPGFIDTHIHFPQTRILGGLGYTLLDWLDNLTLPEEARLADVAYATTLAQDFVRHLAAHGTTTALVFGAHFAPAIAALFEAATHSGLRVISGLVLADRLLRPELHQTPQSAYETSKLLLGRYHAQGRLSYAVIPRFALSASEPLLQVCQTLLREHPSLHFTSHINENTFEVSEVARLFPWAPDYLSVYEKYDLIGRRSVLAHNVQATDCELRRLKVHRCSIAHCPASNAALGSGIFPMRRHLDAEVSFALGTDIGAGTGFGMMKESLLAYLLQRVAPQPMTLSPAQMLYLATRAGAEALALDHNLGDFTPGKSADCVYLKPAPGSPLAGVLQSLESPERILAAILTLAGPECIREVRVEGDLIFENQLT